MSRVALVIFLIFAHFVCNSSFVDQGSSRDVGSCNSFASTPIHRFPPLPRRISQVIIGENYIFPESESKRSTSKSESKTPTSGSLIETPIVVTYVRSQDGSPVNPTPIFIGIDMPLEEIEKIFNDYLLEYPHRDKLTAITTDMSKIFNSFLSYIKDNKITIPLQERNFEIEFYKLYKIPSNNSLSIAQAAEFEKYKIHEGLKQKIHQKWQIQKIIDSFIDDQISRRI